MNPVTDIMKGVRKPKKSQKENKKKWTALNKGKQSQYDAKYRSTHPEQMRALHARYRAKNKEKIAERSLLKKQSSGRSNSLTIAPEIMESAVILQQLQTLASRSQISKKRKPTKISRNSSEKVKSRNNSPEKRRPRQNSHQSLTKF